MMLVAVLSLGLSCSHIRPHVVPVAKQVLHSALKKRFGNACPVGVICYTPEKGASVGESRIRKRVVIESYH